MAPRSASSGSAWLCGLASLSPRQVFLDVDIYRAFAADDSAVRLIALALTFVVITGEIYLSFPSIMALGTAVFCSRWSRQRCRRGSPSSAGSRPARLCGWMNGVLVARLNIPSLVITIGTSFLYRGVELVLMNGTGVPLTPDKYPLMQCFSSPPFGFPIETLWRTVLSA